MPSISVCHNHDDHYAESQGLICPMCERVLNNTAESANIFNTFTECQNSHRTVYEAYAAKTSIPQKREKCVPYLPFLFLSET